MTKKLRKSATLTDIHFGKKSNSPQHNQDCLDFIDWFCEEVRQDSEIDHILFLGDWNENRAAINLQTLNFSYFGAKKLNDLGLPVYFVVGNHDLYHRHTREVYSVLPFKEFSNFHIIDEPKIITEIGDGAFLSPFLFPEEYSDLGKYLELPFWAGHFEFKGFRVTGYNMLMPHGPDHRNFAGPKHILSGHFHQRQQQDNIIYTGNTFPMDFGDAGDFKRGMCVYDHVKQKATFIDWKECPKYMHIKMSKLLDNPTLPEKARVKVRLDADIALEDTITMRDEYMKNFNLREFIIEETSADELNDALSNTDTDAVDLTNTDTNEVHTVDELVIKMLSDIKTDKIDTELLIKEYKALHD